MSSFLIGNAIITGYASPDDPGTVFTSVMIGSGMASSLLTILRLRSVRRLSPIPLHHDESRLPVMDIVG
jgi:hypothetical protein